MPPTFNVYHDPGPNAPVQARRNYRNDLRRLLNEVDPELLEFDTPDARYREACNERSELVLKHSATTWTNDGGSKCVRTPVCDWPEQDRIRYEGACRRAGFYASQLAKLDATKDLAPQHSLLVLGGSIECYPMVPSSRPGKWQ